MQSDKRDKADATTIRMWRQGASVEAIAKALGCSSAAVRGRAVRLRKLGVTLACRKAWAGRNADRLEQIAAAQVATCPWCNGTGSLNPGPVLDSLLVP